MLISEENAWTAISKKGPLVTSSSLLRSLAMEQRRTWFQDAFGKHRKTVRTHFKQLLPDGWTTLHSVLVHIVGFLLQRGENVAVV